MTNQEIKHLVRDAVTSFSNQSLRSASLSLFAALGYKSDRTLAVNTVADFCAQFDRNGLLAHPRAEKANWKSIELLFQLTDEELSRHASLFKDTAVKASLLQSYVFFSVELKPGDYARGKLAAITRQINRVFPMPVMVLFKVGSNLSIAVINRRQNKRDESKDVLGKVTLIQNIAIAKPHPGHLDILASFSTSELVARKKPIGNFDQLHAAWEDVFNVELLNKRFYEELSNWYFWARKQVSFPDDLEKDETKRNATSVIRLLTRLIFCWFLKEKNLIPESLFDEVELKKALASLDATSSQDSTYYRAILQNLFFATLNQPMNVGGVVQRRFAVDGTFHENKEDYGNDALYRYANAFTNPTQALALFEDIPFLNGGLFASLDTLDDKGKKHYADGFSRTAKKQAFVPNNLFFAAEESIDLSADYGDAKKKKAKVRGLLHILQNYKFTITESTPVEQEIALDPELLGNVFENLLASYNPETGESARKQTGSFYTPRPIVDYMVDESLKAYLATALQQRLPKTNAGDAKVGLDILFAYTERDHPFTAKEAQALINAIDACNILDPACGSGAYPMGILHKLVFILGKLDPHNSQWKQRQIDKASEIEDIEARESATRAIERDFADNNLDYGRKLYLIENCIYGVDIQPIAIQISKLRFFISLVCDQKTSFDNDRNRGVRPLPNLEIKFVVANTLIALKPGKTRSSDLQTQISLMDTDIQAFEVELAKVRHRYFSAQTRKEKLALQKKDRGLVKNISDALGDNELDEKNLGSAEVRRRIQWNPYDHHSIADFFEPSTMFGRELEHGFDVVIGNPPYVQIQKFGIKQKAAWQAQGYSTYGATADMYCLFYERGVQLLKAGGHLAYITSNKWMRAGYGEALRDYLVRDVTTRSVVDFGGVAVFSAAMVDTSIVNLTKQPSIDGQEFSATVLAQDYKLEGDLQDYIASNAVVIDTPKDGKATWVVVSSARQRIKSVVEQQGAPLGEWAVTMNYGIKTGFNDAFYLSDTQRTVLIKEDPRSADLIVPLLRGRSLQRYATDWHLLAASDEKWMLFVPWHFPLQLESGITGSSAAAEVAFRQSQPAVYAHLKTHKDTLSARNKAETGIRYEWYALQRWASNYFEDFAKPKIIYPNMTKYLPFYYDSDEHFYVNDKAFIITSASESLPALTAQLNSSLFRCCFMDNFPNLGEDRRELRKIFMDKIPIKKPTAQQAALFEVLVPLVQAAKATAQRAPDTRLQNAANFLEEVIDACVMEIYFAEHMAERDLGITAHVANLFTPLNGQETPSDHPQTLLDFYATANDSKHPIRNMLLRIPLDSPELLAVIQREGAV